MPGSSNIRQLPNRGDHNIFFLLPNCKSTLSSTQGKFFAIIHSSSHNYFSFYMFCLKVFVGFADLTQRPSPLKCDFYPQCPLLSIHIPCTMCPLHYVYLFYPLFWVHLTHCTLLFSPFGFPIIVSLSLSPLMSAIPPKINYICLSP